MRKSWMRNEPGQKLWYYFIWGVDYGFHKGFECGFAWRPEETPNDPLTQMKAKFRMDVTFRLPYIRWNWPWLKFTKGNPYE